MEQLQAVIDGLLQKGWTYAAIGDAIGSRWDTVRRWHLGKHTPTALQAVMAMLRSLESQEPPPKRRYGPDAPQRRSKKDPAVQDRRADQPSPEHH
jgi:hypothetical protein